MSWGFMFTVSEMTHFCWNACWMSVFVLFCRQHKINVMNFRAWIWINETEVASEGTDQRVCRVNYMHDWTTPVWEFSIKCIWIYSISENRNSLWRFIIKRVWTFREDFFFFVEVALLCPWLDEAHIYIGTIYKLLYMFIYNLYQININVQIFLMLWNKKFCEKKNTTRIST